MGSEVSLSKPCTCGPDEACGDPCTPEPECVYDGGCIRATEDCEHGCAAAADELTRQEQEELDAKWAKAMGDEEPLPPQPERRPPYAVAYSVGGHVYELHLPGDASVQAIDGALIIQHHLGPVAGIVQVLPVINKGGADGAE